MELTDFLPTTKNIKIMGLTTKQLKFCYEYAIDLNATRAAIRAGYSESTAYSIGGRLLKNVEVQKYITGLQSDLERTSGITKLKVLHAFAGIAFSNISTFHNTWIEKKDFDKIAETEKAAIQEISSKVVRRNFGTIENPIHSDVEFVKIKLYDRVQALSKIAEMLGFNQPTKIDLTTDLNRLSDIDLDKLYDKVINATMLKFNLNEPD